MQRRLLFDRYLTLWIFLAMALRMGWGDFVANAGELIDRCSIGATNVAIAMGLAVMMYPPPAKVRYEEVGEVPVIIARVNRAFCFQCQCLGSEVVFIQPTPEV
jgi:ACR3 family arsenite efflux pump ArsB